MEIVESNGYISAGVAFASGGPLALMRILLRNRVLLLLAGLGLGAVAQAQPTLVPPAFTWAAAYNVIPGPVGVTLVGYPVATVTPTGDMWLNVADSVITHMYHGLARQRLDHRRPDGSLALRRYLTGRSLIYQLRAAPHGRVYMLGYFDDSLTLDATTTLTTADPNAHEFLACLDSTGTVLYAHDLSARSGQGYGDSRALLPAPNDHVYLGVDAYFGQPVTRIHELDAQGNVVRTLTQTGGMSVTSLDLDAQGALFVTGTCVRPTGGDFNGTFLTPGVSGNGYNQYVACYEPIGTLRWAHFMGDFTCAEPQVRHDAAGGAYWITSLVGGAMFGGVSVPGPVSGGTQDYLLAHLDAAGNTLWARDVATTQTDDAGMARGIGQSLDTDAAGNLYVVGQTRGTIQWAPGVQTTADATSDLLVQRISPAGVVEWARTAAGAMGYVAGSTLAVAPDGSVLITGVGNGAMTFDSLALPAVSRSHFFVARLAQTPSPTATPDPAAASAWHLSPNPATSRVELHPPAGAGPISAELFDALGRRVAQASGEAGLPGFDVRALPAGLYVVRATSTHGTWTGRLVKE